MDATHHASKYEGKLFSSHVLDKARRPIPVSHAVIPNEKTEMIQVRNASQTKALFVYQTSLASHSFSKYSYVWRR